MYLFIFREKRREGERGGEKHQCVVASRAPPTGDLACNPGMCPDWESNQRSFGSQAGAQSTEPHQPRPMIISECTLSIYEKRACCAEMGKVGGGGTNRNMIFEAKILSRAEKAESCNGSWGGKPRTNSLMSRKFMNGGLR